MPHPTTANKRTAGYKSPTGLSAPWRPPGPQMAPSGTREGYLHAQPGPPSVGLTPQPVAGQQHPVAARPNPIQLTPPPPQPGPSPFQGMEAGAAEALRPQPSTPVQPQAVAPQVPAPAQPLPHAQAWDAYMRTGRNPNLGPNAPYGIFTPGGESDRIAGSPAARAMQPPSPVDNHPSLQALRAISSGNHNLQGSMPDIEQRFPSGPVSGAGHYADALANPASNGMLPSNYGANQVYQAHGHMPRTTVGGNFGQGTPNITEDDLRIARNIGIQGNGREAMLASINKRPTGYQPTPRPELDLAQKPQFPAGQYTETPGGSLTPNQGSSAAKRVEAAKQANTASAPARQKYLAGRKAELGKRRELATAKAQEKDKGRRDAVRVKRGHLTVEERFAAANPGAYQARKGMEARMNGEQLMADKRLGLAERQITSNEKIAEGRNKAIVDAQRARTEAENGPAAPKPPPLATAPSLPEQVTGSVRDKATGGDIEGARADLAANGVTNKEDQDKILREATGDQELGLGLTEKPMRPGPASPMDLTNPFSPQAWAGKIGRYIAGKITGKQTKDMQRGPRK